MLLDHDGRTYHVGYVPRAMNWRYGPDDYLPNVHVLCMGPSKMREPYTTKPYVWLAVESDVSATAA